MSEIDVPTEDVYVQKLDLVSDLCRVKAEEEMYLADVFLFLITVETAI